MASPIHPLPERCQIRALREIRDERGSFLKALMREHLLEPARFGEIYLTSAVQGGVKGRHYHRRTSEWFVVIRGRATLWLRDAEPEPGPVQSVELSADQPCCVFVPPGVAHAFLNRHEELLVVLAYADVPYDPADPDTFPDDSLPNGDEP